MSRIKAYARNGFQLTLCTKLFVYFNNDFKCKNFALLSRVLL